MQFTACTPHGDVTHSSTSKCKQHQHRAIAIPSKRDIILEPILLWLNTTHNLVALHSWFHYSKDGTISQNGTTVMMAQCYIWHCRKRYNRKWRTVDAVVSGVRRQTFELRTDILRLWNTQTKYNIAKQSERWVLFYAAVSSLKRFMRQSVHLIVLCGSQFTQLFYAAVSSLYCFMRQSVHSIVLCGSQFTQLFYAAVSSHNCSCAYV